MSFFYLSFGDPDLPEGEQFLGACFVESHSFEAAVGKAWMEGINPGGQIKGIELTDEGERLLKTAPVDWTGKLMNRYELAAMEAQIGKALQGGRE